MGELNADSDYYTYTNLQVAVSDVPSKLAAKRGDAYWAGVKLFGE